MGLKQKSTWLLVGDLPILFKKGLQYVDAAMVKENGKCFGSYIGNVPSLIVSDPEMLKQILVKDFSKFTDRVSVVPIPKLWQSGLSVANGDHWKYLRQTLSPTFSSGKLKHMSSYILNCQRNLMEILEEKRVAQGDGFDITPTFRGFTMDVICSTSFGIEVDSQRNPDNLFIKHAKEFLEVEVAGNPMFLLAFLIPDLTWFVKRMNVKFISNTAWHFFKSTTETLFADRKEASSNHKDFLQLMINASKGKGNNNEGETKGELTYDDYKARGMNDEEVLINSIIFMIAGYETTAVTLCWLAYELALNPEVQDKLIAEIDEKVGKEHPNYENAFKLEYLDMVVSENLRMHPPAGRLNRMAMEDVNICGVSIKKGMEVAYAPLALHYMPEYWSEPNLFNPESFLATLLPDDECIQRIHIATCTSTNIYKNSSDTIEKTNEPQHEISNNVVCATSKVSDQPAHMRSLTRAFSSPNHKDFLQLMINASKGKGNNNEGETKGELTYDDYKARGMNDEEVLINSIIFMIAGYETTAVTLCWLAYELALNPEVQDKLIAEIDEKVGKEHPNYENAFKLEYLDMVVSENLRMHPPAGRLNRMAMEDVNICGVSIKKGMEVAYAPLALHYMPEYWSEPNLFNPERFAPENQDSINPYAYLPFGSGPRNCIGMRLALLEVKMTIIAVLQKYRIVKTSKLKVPMPIGRVGAIKPAEPVFVKLEKRS